jgi:hypothetical protein
MGYNAEFYHYENSTYISCRARRRPYEYNIHLWSSSTYPIMFAGSVHLKETVLLGHANTKLTVSLDSQSIQFTVGRKNSRVVSFYSK